MSPLRAARWSLLALMLLGCPSLEEPPLVLGGGVDVAELRGAVAPFDLLRSSPPGSEIVLSGTVGKVCPAGCWFYLHSDADLVYVDVLGGVVVPQEASGRSALVRAVVEGEGGARTLKAQRIVISPPTVK